jgi:hypothetical protein
MVEWGGAGKPPVFIVGSPRSGSSLLRHILSRHPALAICGETRFFADIHERRSVFGPLDVPENRRKLAPKHRLGPNSILNNAWIWRLFNRAARRSRHQPGYLLVHYEQLVHQPEQELARICAHLGEAWAPSMLLPKDAAAGPYAWPRSARGPAIQERMERWREQLSASFLGDLIPRLATLP